jgi:hypothetical protein
MKRNGKAVLALGVLAAALIAAGGAAFTNSNSLPQTTTAGYGSSNVTGAQAQSIVYVPSSTGDKIESVTIVLNSPVSGPPENQVYTDYSQGQYSVKGGFTRNGGWNSSTQTPNPPIEDSLTGCTVFGMDTGSHTNTVTCPFTPGINTWEVMSFHLLVTNT